MAPARTLITLEVSPWSERAKWALDHHRIAYDVEVHFPVIGERRLRKLAGPGRPKATAPIFIDGDTAIPDSWDIALHADRIGEGSKLVPHEHEAAIREWVARADDAMQSGRALVLGALIESPAALDEAAPPFAPRWARPLLRPVARQVTRTLARKYGATLERKDEHKQKMRAALDALRKGLGVGAMHLLGSFTFADIVMATLLQGISPVANRYIRLGPATRAVWTHADLAADYADLVTWRDRLYDARRRP